MIPSFRENLILKKGRKPTSGIFMMKSYALAFLQAVMTSSMVVPSLPYMIFSQMVAANRTGS